jgi:hypothetical protein
VLDLMVLLFRAIALACRGHQDVVLENLALRYQLRTSAAGESSITDARGGDETHARDAADRTAMSACDQSLTYERTIFNGVNRVERWDLCTCRTCGPYEYRHRTRKLRRSPA